MKKRLSLILLLLILLIELSPAEVFYHTEDKQITIGNSLVSRVFQFEEDGTFFPKIQNYQSKNLLSGKRIKWFEVGINGQLINNLTPVWHYQDITERTLENGGKEFTINIQGDDSLNGLKLMVQVQIFPNSYFFRERIIMTQNENSGSLKLTFKNGNIQLQFPAYNFSTKYFKTFDIEEINLANWEGEVLGRYDSRTRPDDRLNLTGGQSGRNLSQNHMYHPSFNEHEKSVNNIKGPILILRDRKKDIALITAYEHGSPDDDTEQNYIGMSANREKQLHILTQALRGAYYDGEPISATQQYPTYWAINAILPAKDMDQVKEEFHNFLYHYQSEHLASRKPTIYYNTWGMQRDIQMEKKVKPQLVLTEESVLQEIERAKKIGVDVFVIDDGWQTCFGDWELDTLRFPNGLEPIKEKLDKYGMKLGLWFAAEGISPKSKVYSEHPEYLVRDSEGNPVIGRWDQPIGCFSSGYKDYLISLIKKYIDQGVTYFKWDGLDKHFCSSPDHFHGDSSVPLDQRKIRSGYDFILQVTDAVKEITNYNPNVIIVYDVTEELRNVGLAFLSESRFFWINNGATWYDDLSSYRAKSIRTVANQYNKIIPTILQTSANYPHQSQYYGASQYNVLTTFLGGGGFWGDLSELSDQELMTVGTKVKMYKRVKNVIASVNPIVSGKVGSSAEIYEFIDPITAQGAVIAFSGSALVEGYQTKPVKKDKFFAVLNNAYKLENSGEIMLDFVFPQADASNAAYILGNDIFKGYIESSDCWLEDAGVLSSNEIYFISGETGKQVVIWQNETKPQVIGEYCDFEIIKIPIGYRLIINTLRNSTKVTILSK